MTMKSLLYLFRRYKLAATLNLLGLSIAIAAAYLFLTQAHYNSYYNHGLPNYERTYRFEILNEENGSGWSDFVMRPFEVAFATVPHVEAVQSVDITSHEFAVNVGDREFETTVLAMGRPGLRFFGAKMLYGSDKDWQHNELAAIVCRSEAVRLFGTERAVGRQFVDKQRAQTYTVAGVCEDFPENCMMPNGIYTCYGDRLLDDRSEWSYVVYLRLDNADNRAIVEKALKHKVMELFGITDERSFDRESGFKLRLTSMADTYFSGVGLADKGSRNLVGVLYGAAIFVLIVALLNLVNFTLAQAPMRMRGVNTRRVMGASVATLRWRVIIENLVITLIAILLASLWVWLFVSSPTCMRLISGSGLRWSLALITAVGALMVGVASALFPAWYVTSFAPALALKGAFGLTPHGRKLRSLMLFVQFVIAFALVAYVGVMASQSHYIFNTDYGFDKDEVLFAQLSREGMHKKAAIANELRKLPCVASTAYGASELGDGDLFMMWGRGDDTHRMRYNVVPVDKDYLRTMGIRIVEGRDFNDADARGAYIINRNMAKQYGWLRVGSPISISTSAWGEGAYDVVGVCENFKLTSMRRDDSAAPVAFIIMGDDYKEWGDRCGMLFVRVAAGFDKLEAKRQLTGMLQKLDPSQVYEFSFLDEKLQYTYQDEFRFISQVRTFALVCLLVTLVGVFSLTMFESEYRRKEIALRRVMGSSVCQVLLLFVRRYLPLLILAFVVSVPIAWYLADQWLRNFASHAPICWWVFPLSLIVVSVLVTLTVAVQSWRVATTNPVQSIRTE